MEVSKKHKHTFDVSKVCFESGVPGLHAESIEEVSPHIEVEGVQDVAVVATADSRKGSDLSRSERELLKAVYRITDNKGEAHTSVVAAKLGLTAGTITSGIKRLADQNLVVHRPYRGAELTELGARVAIAIIRRHRIVESFLSQALGYSWQDSDRLAAAFEHDLPAEVECRMYDVLGKPAACPHGFPIPDLEATTLESMRRVVDLEVGEQAVVALSGSLGDDVLEYLESLGIHPGVRIEMRDKQPFSGPISLLVDSDQHVIGEPLAARIHVMPILDVTDSSAQHEESHDA